jgi:3D-(3,5/4)-trihydroxycyclohexane-1,2-dione acylhydrolase (decyclizing)
MNPTEILTAVQEGIKLIIIVVDNHGFGSIGGLSASIGSSGFGTRFNLRDPHTGQLTGERLVVDFAANAASLGAEVFSPDSIASFKEALIMAKKADHTSVIVIETDREVRVPGYESWWDVAIAETSTMPEVQNARAEYEKKQKTERYFL